MSKLVGHSLELKKISTTSALAKKALADCLFHSKSFSFCGQTSVPTDCLYSSAFVDARNALKNPFRYVVEVHAAFFQQGNSWSPCDILLKQPVEACSPKEVPQA